MKYALALGGDCSYTEILLHHLSSIKHFYAADGGLRHLRALKHKPVCVFGDMDSLKKEDWDWIETEHIPIHRFMRAKNHTDLGLLIQNIPWKKGDEVLFLGAFGSERLDHQAGNLAQARYLLEKGVQVLLTDGFCFLYLIKGPCSWGYEWNEERYKPDVVSVLCPMGTAENINYSGLAYPLKQGRFTVLGPSGLSNLPAAHSHSFEITVGRGYLDLYLLYSVQEQMALPDASFFERTGQKSRDES